VRPIGVKRSCVPDRRQRWLAPPPAANRAADCYPRGVSFAGSRYYIARRRVRSRAANERADCFKRPIATVHYQSPADKTHRPFCVTKPAKRADDYVIARSRISLRQIHAFSRLSPTCRLEMDRRLSRLKSRRRRRRKRRRRRFATSKKEASVPGLRSSSGLDFKSRQCAPRATRLDSLESRSRRYRPLTRRLSIITRDLSQTAVNSIRSAAGSK